MREPWGVIRLRRGFRRRADLWRGEAKRRTSLIDYDDDDDDPPPSDSRLRSTTARQVGAASDDDEGQRALTKLSCRRQMERTMDLRRAVRSFVTETGRESLGQGTPSIRTQNLREPKGTRGKVKL